MKPFHFTEALGAAPRNSELTRAARALVDSGEDPDAERALASALVLEQRIERALNIEPPALLAERLLAISRQVPSRSGWQLVSRKIMFAVAASFTAGAILAGTWVWSTQNAIGSQLVADCVEHLSHEPYALSRTTRVPHALLSQLFARSGLTIDENLIVNYLQPCVVNGQAALHIVMQQASGPVTVMIMTTSESIGDFERSLAEAQVRVRGFEAGSLVFMAESSRDFDVVEAKLIASLGI